MAEIWTTFWWYIDQISVRYGLDMVNIWLSYGWTIIKICVRYGWFLLFCKVKKIFDKTHNLSLIEILTKNKYFYKISPPKVAGQKNMISIVYLYPSNIYWKWRQFCRRLHFNESWRNNKSAFIRNLWIHRIQMNFLTNVDDKICTLRLWRLHQSNQRNGHARDHQSF